MHALIRNYGFVVDSPIYSINLTKNDKYLFVSNIDGVVKQLSIKDRTIVAEYKEEGSKKKILMILTTYDNRFWISIDNESEILIWCVRKFKQVQKLD